MATWEILQTLQEEVGSRRAGTEGERRALDWLTARCHNLGLAVELDEFTFISSESYRSLLMLFLLLWLSAGLALSMAGRPLLAGLMVVSGLYFFFNFRKRIEIRLARTPSYNVIAGLDRPIAEYITGSEKGPAVLICAHYDTPRNRPGWQERVRGLTRFILPLSLLGLVLFAVAMILLGLGRVIAGLSGGGVPEAITTLTTAIGWAAVVVTAPMLLMLALMSLSALLGKKSDSPGADDNGSGTALVLEMARRLKASPPTSLEVFFAWWGAEEYGLFGSRQFVRRFHDRLNKDNFYVVNADCVGVGRRLVVHTGQGTIFRRPTDPATIARLERVASQLGIKSVRSWESVISGGSSDHAEWVDRGYRHAISVLRENDRPMSPPARILAALLRIPDANQLEIDHIHTPGDTIDGIRPEVLAETADLVEAYVRQVDGELANQLVNENGS